MIKKDDIKNMSYWEHDIDREYDFIYIVPSNKKMGEYKMAYFLGQIGDEIKIINEYDCGAISDALDKNPLYIRFDFEVGCAGLKLWNGRRGKKLQYRLDHIFGS